MAGRERADVNDFCRLTPIFSSEGRWATGAKISASLSSQPMKPRSKRWSMLGVSRSPSSPLVRSSLLESRHGLRWLATRWIGLDTPAIRQRSSICITRSLKSPWPRRARIIASRSVSVIDGSASTVSRSVLPIIKIVAGLHRSAYGHSGHKGLCFRTDQARQDFGGGF